MYILLRATSLRISLCNVGTGWKGYGLKGDAHLPRFVGIIFPVKATAREDCVVHLRKAAP